MIFVIKLTYIRPAEDIQVHLEAHKAWLTTCIESGRVLFAGPLEQGGGGLILAHAQRSADLRAMLAEDPFEIHQLATFEVLGCEPAIRAVQFDPQWASGARSVGGV